MAKATKRKATRALEQAIELDPGHHDAIVLLADDIYYMADLEKYVMYQEMALAIKPIEPNRWHQLALAYSSLGKSEKMKSTCERGLKHCPDAQELKNLLGSL